MNDETDPGAGSAGRGAEQGLPEHCTSCGKSLSGRPAIRLRGNGRMLWKCRRCAFFDAPLAARSARAAAIVGTVLVGLNQGDQILAGTFPFATAWWKLPLTYAVPFCVSTYGALSNGYRGAPERR